MATTRLLDVMDKLRAECPWDREQTFDSLRNNTIEETYELADAITDKNMEGIKEELGDLLLHVVFYSKLGEEQGEAVLTTGLKSVAPVTYKASLFILASSVCKSLQYLTSTLTQGGKGNHLFRLTCSIVLRGGMNTANKYHCHVCGVLAVSGPQWVCFHTRCVCFLGLHCSGSKLLCRQTV